MIASLASVEPTNASVDIPAGIKAGCALEQLKENVLSYQYIHRQPENENGMAGESLMFEIEHSSHQVAIALLSRRKHRQRKEG
jgi:hypothetical protein